MAKKPESKKYNTPVGRLVFPRLTQPDTKFKAEGEFSTKLVLPTDDPVTGKMIALADRVAEAALAEGKANAKPADVKKWAINNRPYSAELDDDGNETGNTVFVFKATASGVSKKTGKPWTRRIDLFDAKGKPLPKKDGEYAVQIWGGTEASICFEAFPYAPNAKIGAGCKFGLVAAQIVKLVSGGEGRDASAYGFEKRDDGFDSDELGETETSDGEETSSEKSDGSAGEDDDF